MSTIIYDINSLTSDSPIVICVDFTIPNSSNLRITSNNEAVTFGGNVFTPLEFQISTLSDGTGGEVPEITFKLNNINRVMETYLHSYDTYLKTNGFSGNEITAVLYVVNTKDTSEALKTEYLLFISASTDSQWATFKLGANSPFNWRYPRRRIIKNFCSFKFKDSRCQYSGADSICKKTMSACLEKDNILNYGGFPGIGNGLRLLA